MARPIEYNPAFGSIEQHTSLFEVRIRALKDELDKLEQRGLPSEVITSKLDELEQQFSDFITQHGVQEMSDSAANSFNEKSSIEVNPMTVSEGVHSLESISVVEDMNHDSKDTTRVHASGSRKRSTVKRVKYPVEPDRLEHRTPEQLVILKEEIQAIERDLEGLTPTERMVIRLRFGVFGEHPSTLAQVGAQLGFSPERARQIEYRALVLLKRMRQDRENNEGKSKKI